MKYELVVCCRLTPLQEELYRKIIKRKSRELLEEELEGKKADTLAFITNLKKLCNHPQLILDKCEKQEAGFEGCAALYPADFARRPLDPLFSGKMKVLDYLLAITKRSTSDKFVLVSNYTQTMDAFMEVRKCRWPRELIDNVFSFAMLADTPSFA